MGTITMIGQHRHTVPMEGKEQRTVSINPSELRQFDHGYAVTSHRTQASQRAESSPASIPISAALINT